MSPHHGTHSPPSVYILRNLLREKKQGFLVFAQIELFLSSMYSSVHSKRRTDKCFLPSSHLPDFLLASVLTRAFSTQRVQRASLPGEFSHGS
jgi:hypothetical protein